MVDRSETVTLCVVYLWCILNLMSFGALAVVEQWTTEHSPLLWSLYPSLIPSSFRFCKLHSFELELVADNVSTMDLVWLIWINWKCVFTIECATKCANNYLSQKCFCSKESMAKLAFDFHLMMFQQYSDYLMILHCTEMVGFALVEELGLRPPAMHTINKMLESILQFQNCFFLMLFHISLINAVDYSRLFLCVRNRWSSNHCVSSLFLHMQPTYQ